MCIGVCLACGLCACSVGLDAVAPTGCGLGAVPSSLCKSLRPGRKKRGREESGGMVQVDNGSCVLEKIYLTPQYEGQTHIVLKMLFSASDNEAQSNGAMFSEQMLSRS